MGWLWASSKSSTSAQDQKPLSPPSTEQASAPNEPIDPEIQKFFDLFKSDPDQQPSKPQPQQSTESSSSSSSAGSTIASWLSLRKSSSAGESDSVPDAPLGDSISESLLPTEMSCRQAFDLAWSCNSLGGQFNSVYRYGEMRGCSEHWDDFWFCMRTKNYTGELKENMVKAHYRNKAYRKYGSDKPSSEDIWESRKEKMPPGSAFSQTVEAPTVGDEEWRQMEESRRANIRKSLGYES